MYTDTYHDTSDNYYTCMYKQDYLQYSWASAWFEMEYNGLKDKQKKNLFWSFPSGRQWHFSYISHSDFWIWNGTESLCKQRHWGFFAREISLKSSGKTEQATLLKHSKILNLSFNWTPITFSTWQYNYGPITSVPIKTWLPWKHWFPLLCLAPYKITKLVVIVTNSNNNAFDTCHARSANKSYKFSFDISYNSP